MDSILRPALVLMAGRSLGVAATFFIPVVLARIFDQAEFGTYKQLFLIYSTFYGIGQLGMAESLFYFLPLASQRGGRYIVNSMLVLAGAGLACVALLDSAGAKISQWLGNPELSRHMFSLSMYLLLMMTSAVLEIAMIARRRYLWASFSYGFSDLLRAGLFIAPVVLVGRLEWLLVGGVVFASLRLCATLCYLNQEFAGEFRPDAGALKRQLAYGLPFQMSVLLAIAEANFHQYAVAYHFDAATFAIYAVGCLQIPFIDFVMTSAGSVMMVKMSEQIQEGRPMRVLAVWHETTRKLALVCFPVVGLLLIVANEVIILLFTESYHSSVPIFMVWSTAILFGSLQTDGVLRVYADNRFLLALYGVRLLLVVTLITWFLSVFHLLGAAFVAILALCIAKGLALARIRRLMQVELSEFLPWRNLAGMLAAAGGASVAALIVKWKLDMPILALLVMTSVVYAVAYGLGLYGFRVFNEDERAALKCRLDRWVGGLVKPELVKRS